MSDRFKSAVQANGLRGLDFLWLIDAGRYAAPQQWWVPVPLHTIGRGLDDDWVDPARRCDGYARGGDASHGRFAFDALHLRLGVQFGDAIVERLFALLPMERRKELHTTRFRRPERYLGAFLPDADFAYGWNGAHAHGTHPGPLYLSRRAKTVLEAAGVLRNEECLAVLVLDDAPPGVLTHDEPGQTGAPHLRADVLSVRRSAAAEAWRRHQEVTKPQYRRTLRDALGDLRLARKTATERFVRGASMARVAAATRDAPLPVPAGWLAMLRLTNGGAIGQDLEQWRLTSAEDLREDHLAELDIARHREPDFRADLLRVGSNAYGDTLWLDTSSVTAEGDRRVLQVSHETMEPVHEWPSVAGFIDELLDLLRPQ